MATAAEPHRLCKTAVPIQECCTICDPPATDPPITVAAADPPTTVSAADPPITVCHPLMFSVPPITVKDTVLIVLSLLYFVVERYHSVP